ncbi:MAG TPA: DNA repair protein RecN [Gemmatimonadaceae bacterium]
MLTELRVRNFAIIESVTLPLAGGLNVLTGETGAGKSIIVGALSLLLGERASVDTIRTGADRAVVEGVFDASAQPALLSLLDERGIDVNEGTVVLRREVASTGRTRAWINGCTTTAGVLAEVGRIVVNLHGQREAETLLDPEAQRRILDAFSEASNEVERVRSRYEELGAVTRDIESLTRRRTEAARRADYLRHVAAEVEDARLREGEDVALEEEARRLEHADELRSLVAGFSALLDGDEESVLPHLAQGGKALISAQRMDPSLSRMQELFDGAYYSLEELSRQLDDYAASVELDPARLEEVQRRRDLLFRLMKKYGPSLADVMETGRKARAELDLVDTAELDLEELERRRASARAALEKEAAALTKRRTAGAKKLSRAVGELLPALGMPHGKLVVALTPRAEIASTGAEDVEFQVALNVGHEARALARVASGGELSRLMLALETILARQDHVPTLIFDEVDAGIGGRVGLQVGDTMRRVAGSHQVLAITHLAQIAARAHHHIVVSKGERAGITTTDTRVATGEERVNEIARMLGGDPESEVSLAHARELLAGVQGG